jgi:hypothetical protein
MSHRHAVSSNAGVWPKRSGGIDSALKSPGLGPGQAIPKKRAKTTIMTIAPTSQIKLFIYFFQYK